MRRSQFLHTTCLPTVVQPPRTSHTMRWVLVALAAAWPSAQAVAQMDMTTMPRTSAIPLGLPENRMGSGTSWLPDAAPMQAIHLPLGTWTAMVHGAASLFFDAQGGPRGATETKLINWGMGSLA